MRVIVFGASGPSGLELIARARAAGHRVGGFARRPRPSNVPADVEWVTGDAMEAVVVADAVRAQDADKPWFMYYSTNISSGPRTCGCSTAATKGGRSRGPGPVHAVRADLGQAGFEEGP